MAEPKLTKAQRKAAAFKAAKRDNPPAAAHDDADHHNAQRTPRAAQGEPRHAESEAAASASDGEQPAASRKRKRVTTTNASAAPSATRVKPSQQQRQQPQQQHPDNHAESSRAPHIAPSTATTKATVAKKRTKTVFDKEGNESSRVALDAEADIGKASEEHGADDGKGKSSSSTTSRFIVFVGNMSYKTTAQAVADHFEPHCSQRPQVRLLTTRADPSRLASLSASKRKSVAKGRAADPSAPTSRGCAFVEFDSALAMRKALAFHGSYLEGRQVRVQLTAGGGGSKSQARREKIREKNDKLAKEREKLKAKQASKHDEDDVGAEEAAAAVPADAEGRAAKKHKPARAAGGEGERQGGGAGGGAGSQGRAARKREEQKAKKRTAKRTEPAGGTAAPGGRLPRPPTASGAGSPRVPRWMLTGANAVRLSTAS